ncbi:MAG: hypothetical protein B7Z02_07545 [Rhodobacterales bacterium 32-67-9]|nr:MAG: hypothetical protein B7Z02_07545 [Rhodobacterales bacterium 32-67-9]
MQISRNFLVIGSVYLLFGILMGMYMGGSGDLTFAPVHAHINLLGFTLMTLFGLVYRALPTMADSSLARVHFWLHQIGALVLLAMLMLLFSGQIVEAAMAPVAPIAELAVLLGVGAFAVNLWRNA